jgi:kanamycin kinase
LNLARTSKSRLKLPWPRALADSLAKYLGPMEPVSRSKAGVSVAYLPDVNRYAKFAERHGGLLRAEADRLEWLRIHRPDHPVPRVDRLIDEAEWTVLVTHAVDGLVCPTGDSDNHGLRDSGALALALRRLHSLPLTGCPFDWSVDARIDAFARHGVAVSETLRDSPSIDLEVVSHGEAFLPNLLVGSDGAFAAQLDFPRLGRADRWADLAAATLSLSWNFPSLDLTSFWSVYGTTPDETRLAYYRALWKELEATTPWVESSSTILPFDH